jgi:Ca2+-binding RTX toxin-like protein
MVSSYKTSRRISNGAQNMANIIGTAGNDNLTGLDGNDVIDGGAGTDTLTISDGTGTVTINLVLGTSQGTVRSGLDLISNIERYNVFAGAIDFTGDANDNFIQASANIATLRGGAGNDRYLIQNADAVIIENAGEGVDEVIVQSSYILPANVENGSFEFFTSGNFNLTGNDLANILRGTDENNTLSGGIGNDSLFGNNGNDILDGGQGDDRFDGGNGDDTYIIDSSADLITFDQTGNDTVISSVNYILQTRIAVENLRATTGAAVTLTGNEFAQFLFGSEANNRLNGLGDNDVLDGGAGADILDGGAGIDSAIYSNAVGGIFADLAGGYVLETSQTIGSYGSSTITLSQDSLIAVENVVGSNFDDRLYGHTANNVLAGGNGNDILYGDAGSDTVSFASNSGAVFVDFPGRYALETTTTTGTVLASDTIVSTDYYFEFENIIGSNFGDRIYGNSDDNILSGFGGSDILYGDAGSDTVSFASNIGAVFVDMNAFYGLETAVTTGTVSGAAPTIGFDYFFEFENLTGSNFGDRLYGNAADNIISGLGGTDIIYGGAGNDTISYAGNIGTVSVNLATSFAQETDETIFATGFVRSNDFIYEFENIIGSDFSDILTGSSDANKINGGAGDDAINGGLGDDIVNGGMGGDTINGSLGNDILTGGEGRDRFYFDNASVDQITDFVSLTDDIYISRSYFGLGTATSVNLVTNGPAVVANSFIFDTNAQTLSFDADGAGAGATVLVATFTGVASLSAPFDFVLYG